MYEERTRLARDIHDGLGHHLTVLNIQLQAATKLIEQDKPQALKTIQTCREQAQSAMKEVRDSVAMMRGTPLDGQHFHEAIQELVTEFGQQTNLFIDFNTQGIIKRLSLPAEMTLYRAVQEGLTNIQKHANASRADVLLRYTPEFTELFIQDNGTTCANNPNTIPSNGFGLAGLRERVEQLDGTFTAGCKEDRGYELKVVIPFTEVAQ